MSKKSILNGIERGFGRLFKGAGSSKVMQWAGGVPQKARNLFGVRTIAENNINRLAKMNITKTNKAGEYITKRGGDLATVNNRLANRIRNARSAKSAAAQAEHAWKEANKNMATKVYKSGAMEFESEVARKAIAQARREAMKPYMRKEMARAALKSAINANLAGAGLGALGIAGLAVTDPSSVSDIGEYYLGNVAGAADAAMNGQIGNFAESLWGLNPLAYAYGKVKQKISDIGAVDPTQIVPIEGQPGGTGYYITFDDYRPAMPDGSRPVKAGHAGALIFDENGGSPIYYDYGRYNNGFIGKKANGNFRTLKLPAGLSQEEYIKRINEFNHYQGNTSISEIPNVDYKGVINWVDSVSNDPNRVPYSLKDRNCGTVAYDMLDENTKYQLPVVTRNNTWPVEFTNRLKQNNYKSNTYGQ